MDVVAAVERSSPTAGSFTEDAMHLQDTVTRVTREVVHS